MKAREVINVLKADSWEEVARRSIHRQFKHATKLGRVTVPDHGAIDIPPGTLASIWRQAGIKSRDTKKVHCGL